MLLTDVRFSMIMSLSLHRSCSSKAVDGWQKWNLEQKWIKKRPLWIARSAFKSSQMVLSTRTKLFVDVSWVTTRVRRVPLLLRCFWRMFWTVSGWTNSRYRKLHVPKDYLSKKLLVFPKGLFSLPISDNIPLPRHNLPSTQNAYRYSIEFVMTRSER